MKTTTILTKRKYRDVSYLVKEGQGLYVLLFKGKLMNLHTIYKTRQSYDRIAWANEAHAQNRANKLNKIFQTDAFTIKEVEL